jgi:DNA-binding MarR family transcriptional regulator
VSDEELTPVGETATRLVLATFRTNGALLDAGDRLTADQGLTSALWQVLGAAALAERPLTVAQIARRMGLSRQSVHGSVRRLAERGLCELAPNENHRRSPLVQLTEAGEAAYITVDRKRVKWVNRLVAGIPNADLETAERVLEALCQRLDQEGATNGAESADSAA